MSRNEGTYEQLFGPDKNKQNTGQNQDQQTYGQKQQYNQYQNQQLYGPNQQYGPYQNQQQSYNQYPSQQQTYGQNPNQQQPPQYGQYQNQLQPQNGQNANNQQYNQYPNQQPYNQCPNQQKLQYVEYQNQQQQYGQNAANQQKSYNQNHRDPNQNYQQSPGQYSNQPYGQNQANQHQTYDQNINRPQTQLQQSPIQQNNTINNPPIMNNPIPQQIQLPPIDQTKINNDAAALRKAMKGLGTDEKAIIKIIANRTNRERLAMIDSFKRQFNRDLIKDLKSELSGNFENATLALFQDPITYDCCSLKKAMKGLGTDEDTLIEILATRPNYYIIEIKKKYLTMYGKSLEQDLSSDLSGDLKKVMLTLASAFRSENQNPNQADCHDKAEQLYKAGEKRLGTNEKVFYDILTKASPQELTLINKIYEQNYKHGLLKAIDNEFSGNMKKLLKTIVYVSLNPSEYFATRVQYAVKGLGTKDKLLIRILVTRDEIDMPQIKEAYKRLYNKDMVKDIESDTSGDYKRLLVELCSH